MKTILNPEEIVFLKKLCNPEPFFLTLSEQPIIEKFIKQHIIKICRNGAIEVTNFGADCYVATLDN